MVFSADLEGGIFGRRFSPGQGSVTWTPPLLGRRPSEPRSPLAAPPPGSRPTSLLSSLSNPVRPVSRIPDFFLRTRCTIAPAPPISKPPLLWGPAAIIIAALPPLFNYKEFLFLWRVNKFDCLVFSAAFLGTVFLGVELGLAISIGVPWGLSGGGGLTPRQSLRNCDFQNRSSFFPCKLHFWRNRPHRAQHSTGDRALVTMHVQIMRDRICVILSPQTPVRKHAEYE